METSDLFDEIDSKFKRIRRNTVVIHGQKRKGIKEIIQRYR